MSTADHRNSLDPAIVGRLAASMESIRDAWQIDLDALRSTEAELASVRSALDANAFRLDDVQADLVAASRENASLIQQNANLRAELDKFGEISLDARNRLEDFANRVARAQTTDSAPFAASDASRLIVDDLARIPPRPTHTPNDDRRERGMKPLPGEERIEVPLFLRNPAAVDPPYHRTIPPTVDFPQRQSTPL
jgi:hypothetical protein